MLQLNSSLVAIAAEFTGKYAPYQAVEISPAPGGGAYISSTDKGKIACLAFDASATIDETVRLLPDPELIKCCRGIKTAERQLFIEGNNAVVTTFRKTTQEKKEFIVNKSISDFPPLASAVKACLDRWSAQPTVSATAGRYESRYIERALRGLSSSDDSIILSAFDGGPLRIQTDQEHVVILVMPQTAEKIPCLPQWLKEYAQNSHRACTVNAKR